MSLYCTERLFIDVLYRMPVSRSGHQHGRGAPATHGIGKNTGSWLTMPDMALAPEEKQQLLARVAAFEAATGVQLVTAQTPRCDDYPEIPWKAFAAGVAFCTLLLGLALLIPSFSVLQSLTDLSTGMTLVLVLGAGLACGGLAIAVPPAARLFLSSARAEGETRRGSPTAADPTHRCCSAESIHREQCRR